MLSGASCGTSVVVEVILPSEDRGVETRSSRARSLPLAEVAFVCSNEPVTPDHEPDALREQSPPYTPPPETQRLIDELYREELREARAMSPERKLLLGEELFVYACSITMAGIQNQFPEAD